MLAKKNRLSKASDFQRVLKSGRKVWGRFFTLKYLSAEAEGESRFGFIVTTKISKKATVRNRIKRRLRASASKYWLGKLEKPLWGVVIAQANITNADQRQIDVEFVYIWKKLQSDGRR